ncbi:MAG: diguanylate cyclase [Planctomyces sp.]|nr:diguanylate cyclase [Planctomyces sp.]
MAVEFQTLNRLPSIPIVAVRLLECFSNPDASITDIAEIVRTDPAITAKIMRSASTSRFAGGRQVTDLLRAVNLLGRKQVTSLALCFSLSEDSMRHGPFAGLYKSVWLRSLLQAMAAGLIASRQPHASEGEAFVGGLLAEIGRLAMLKSKPQEYAVEAEQEFDPSLDAASKAQLRDGFDRLSVALLTHWKLPTRFSSAVNRRNDPVDQLAAIATADERNLVSAVALASAIADYFIGDDKGLALVRISELGECVYGMSADEIDVLLETLTSQLADSAGMFDVDVSMLGAPAEIMAEAMDQLARLAGAAAEGQADSATLEQLVDENGRLKQRIEDLVRRSSVDALTGVYNRGYFDGELAERAATATASRTAIGLLFIDADHFKSINDTYGHAAGDAALRKIAQVILRMTRTTDIVARYGGEEFVVLVGAPSILALQSLAERIRAAIEQESFAFVSEALRATVSVGGAVIEPPHPDELATSLVETADEALYSAKQSGRNRTELRRRPDAAAAAADAPACANC